MFGHIIISSPIRFESPGNVYLLSIRMEHVSSIVSYMEQTHKRFLKQDIHWVMMGGRDDPAILDISMSWDTVSKAAVKSMAIPKIWWGGFHCLKPVSMSVVDWRRADVVVCLGLKLCWSLVSEINLLIEGKMCASRTLAAWHSSEMGLLEVPCDESLPGFEIGMTNEVFQIDVGRQDLREYVVEWCEVFCS